MKKGILFDLDGTLWDAGEGVVISWNRVMERMGREERFTIEQLHSMMGKTMAEIAHIAFAQETPEEAERILAFCTDEENAYLAEHGGTLYEGVPATLKALREKGYFLGIVSNCQEGYIEAFLKAHHLESMFEDTENYGRTGQGKAHNIRLVVERNGLDALYVGDTMGDYDAAMGAGLPFIHAAYGYGTVPEGTPKVFKFTELPEAVDLFP